MKLVHSIFCVMEVMAVYKAVSATCADIVRGYVASTAVLNMCEGGSVVGRQVVIDTYKSSNFTSSDSQNCSCTATVLTPIGALTNLYLYPIKHPPEGCGSYLKYKIGNQYDETYNCIVHSVTTVAISNGTKANLTWFSGDADSNARYCLHFRVDDGKFFSLNFECVPLEMYSSVMTMDPPLNTKNHHKVSTTTKTLTKQSLPPTVFTTILLKKKKLTTESRQEPTSTIIHCPTVATCTKCQQTMSSSVNIPIVPICIGGGVVVLVMMLFTVTNIILYRRRISSVRRGICTRQHLDSCDNNTVLNRAPIETSNVKARCSQEYLHLHPLEDEDA